MTTRQDAFLAEANNLASVSIGDFASNHETVRVAQTVAQCGHIMNPDPKPVPGFVVYGCAPASRPEPRSERRSAVTETYACENCREETKWQGTVAVASTRDAALDIALAFGPTFDGTDSRLLSVIG